MSALSSAIAVGWSLAAVSASAFLPPSSGRAQRVRERASPSSLAKQLSSLDLDYYDGIAKSFAKLNNSGASASASTPLLTLLGGDSASSLTAFGLSLDELFLFPDLPSDMGGKFAAATSAAVKI